MPLERLGRTFVRSNRLLKNSPTRVVTWKSGASAPRKIPQFKRASAPAARPPLPPLLLIVAFARVGRTLLSDAFDLDFDFDSDFDLTRDGHVFEAA